METATPTGQRILVVDDEPDIVALIVYHVAKAGYRVSTASTGTDGLDAARRENPALVILDLMLPGMSGYDVLEQLRASEPTQSIGVLMLTARVEEADRVRGLALGADDYLTKPFSPARRDARAATSLRLARSRLTARRGDCQSVWRTPRAAPRGRDNHGFDARGAAHRTLMDVHTRCRRAR